MSLVSPLSSHVDSDTNISSHCHTKKKPGRKPDPASPALRKAQNRAAQRAFRERKERHIMELESESKQLREQRDELLVENKALRSSVGVLGQEGSYLKGLVLSLQLVCLLHKVAIPHHAPHLNTSDLLIYAQHQNTTTRVLSSYSEICKHNVPPSSSTKYARINKHKPTHQITKASILVSKDEIRTIAGCDASIISSSSQIQHVSLPSTPKDHVPELNKQSIMTDDTQSIDSFTHDPKTNDKKQVADTPIFNAEPIMLTRDPVPSFNLANFQTTRLHRLLQSACSKMAPVHNGSFVIEPTVLQCSVAHDPRIDLIPVAGVRDRMILFFDFFDLDECLKCLLDGIQFVDGGDPTHVGSWRWPAEFYEKYWYLSHDYSSPVIQERWPDLQSSQQQQSLVDLLLSPPNTSANDVLAMLLLDDQQQQQHSPSPPPSLSSDAQSSVDSRHSSIATDDDDLLSMLSPENDDVEDMSLDIDDLIVTED